MSKMVHAPRLLRLALLALLAVVPACQTAQAPPPATPPPDTGQMTQNQQGSVGDEDPKLKVKPVNVILKDGVVQPVEKVKIKRYSDIIVWATNGSSLQIKWKGKDPLPELTCAGAFCGTLKPTTADPGVYSYAVTVDGKTLDPDVEVEPGP